MSDQELSSLPPMTIDRELTDEDLFYLVDKDDPANTSKQLSAARLVWSADGQPTKLYGGGTLHLSGTAYLPAIAQGTELVDADSAQTLANKTLTQATLTAPTITGPIIGATDWGQAQHNHSAASRGGTIDHGALTGRTDDDHTQYHNNSRGDARYYKKADVYTKTEADGRYSRTTHTHDTTHLHDSRYSQLGHTHNYAAASHTHNYAAASHTHSYLGTVDRYIHQNAPMSAGQTLNINIPSCKAIVVNVQGVAKVAAVEVRPFHACIMFDGQQADFDIFDAYVPHATDYGEYVTALSIDWDPGRTYDLVIQAAVEMYSMRIWSVVFT